MNGSYLLLDVEDWSSRRMAYLATSVLAADFSLLGI